MVKDNPTKEDIESKDPKVAQAEGYEKALERVRRVSDRMGIGESFLDDIPVVTSILGHRMSK